MLRDTNIQPEGPGIKLHLYIPDETTQPPELQTPPRALTDAQKKRFQYLLPYAVIYS